MTGIPPGSQQQPPDQAVTPAPELMLPAPALSNPPPQPVPGPAETPPTSISHRSPWFTPIVMVMVLTSALTMLLTGHSLQDALTLAGGVTLLGGEIARRTLTDAGPGPSLMVAAAVATFAVVLIIRHYPLDQVTVISGLAGLVAGEVAARFPRSTSREEG